MCGIAGFCGSFEPVLLERMNRVLAHRGPDDAGVWYTPKHGVGLAHRRLSIIDLSARGRQPMTDPTGRATISFNGEIYNYRELRATLEDQGYRFCSNSDTEVLLNLYLAERFDMLQRLNGIFAFAIYDSYDGTLFVARDGVGVKPLYYAQPHPGFIFASELKALLLEPSLERSIDSQAVRHYLTYLWCPAPRTMLRSVKKLEPGHALVVGNGQICRHWQFYDLPRIQPDPDLTETQARERLDRALQQAVRRQMVADVPVGSFLSGGLDSSAVVALARESTDYRLQCFTIAFDGFSLHDEGMSEDLPYATRVAEHLNVDLHTVRVRTSEMLEHLRQMVYHLDEPQGDPAPLAVYFISRLASDLGIKVLLSGTGGDDIFTGYRRHFALQQERYWAWLPPMVRQQIARLSRELRPRSTLARRVGKALRHAPLDADHRIASYFEWLDSSLRKPLYGPLLLQSEPESRNNPLLRALESLPPDLPPLQRMLYLEGKYFLGDHNLNYTDKMSMAAGVEVRVPLLDRDLIDQAALLPTRLKQRGRIGKWIFKRTMESRLPSDVIYRPKTGFAMPLRRWLRHELHSLVDEVLSERSLRSRGLFDPSSVRRLVALDRDHRVDATYPIFSIICIELWCRIFLDERVVENLTLVRELPSGRV